jgi:hypothetical protein
MRGRTLSRVLWVRGLLRVVPFWTLNPNAKNFMLLPPSSAFADEWTQQQVGWVGWTHATGDYLSHPLLFCVDFPESPLNAGRRDC